MTCAADVIKLEMECEELLGRIQDWRDRYNADQHFRDYCNITGFKESSSVKRGSLDLSRALTEFRKA